MLHDGIRVDTAQLLSSSLVQIPREVPLHGLPRDSPWTTLGGFDDVLRRETHFGRCRGGQSPLP